MVRKLIAFLLITFISTAVQAQQNSDSLLLILKSTDSDYVKVDILKQLCKTYAHNIPDSSIYYGKRGIVLAQQLGATTALADIYTETGVPFIVKGQYDSAAIYFKNAHEIAVEYKLKEQEATALSRLGIINYLKGNYTESLTHFLKSLDIIEQHKLNVGRASVLSNVGNIYFKLEDYSKALEYYKNAAESNKIAKNKHQEAICMTNIGLVYEKTNDYELAQQFLKEALKLYGELGNTKAIANTYNGLGVLAEKSNQLNLAIEYYTQAGNLCSELGDTEGQISSLVNLASAYSLQGKKVLAITSGQQALHLALSSGLKPKEKVAYETMATVYEAMGNYKLAYHFQQKFMALKDTLFNEVKSEQIANLETLYETVKKEKEIEVLKKDQELQASELSFQTKLRNGAFVLVALLVIIGILAYNRFKLKSRNYQQQVRLAEADHKEAVLLSEKEKLVNEKLQVEVEFAHRELASSSLFIHNKNETLSMINKKLVAIESTNPDLRKQLKDIKSIINENINLNHEWENLKIHFDKVHPVFFEKLLELCPDLTKNELKHCAYIKINLSNKEIARLLNINPSSVHISRYRLKKKLNLDEEVNISEFVSSI